MPVRSLPSSAQFAPARAVPASAAPAWRRRATPLLGTLVEITLLSPSETDFVRATDAAFARVADVHRAMSFHEASSDLRLLARAPAGAEFQVAADTWAVLQLALEIERLSDGIFNPCIAPQLVACGCLPAPGGWPPRSSRAVPRLADVLRLQPGQCLRVRESVWVDLGGIAKGYAVDCAVRALQQLGLHNGLVNAGGDMRAFGDVSHPVHLRFADGLRLVAELMDGALATSCNAAAPAAPAAPAASAAQRGPPAPPVPPVPHIDPRTGCSVASNFSAVVHAPSAAVADALSKVALICPTTAERMAPALHAQWRAYDFFAPPALEAVIAEVVPSPAA